MPAIVSKETFSKIRLIVDGTNQMLRALPNLGVKVNHWDPFIILIINMKLDDETRSDWKQSVGRKEKIKVKDMLDILETKAIELQPSQGDKLRYLLKGEMPKEISKTNFSNKRKEKA